MNRCLRSLSCVLTLTALTLFSTDAPARPKPKPAGKAHEAKRSEAKRPEAKTHDAKPARAAKDARPPRSTAVGKRPHAKHADAKRKSKPSMRSRRSLLARCSVSGWHSPC